MANCGIWNPNTRMYEAIGYDRKLETSTKEMTEFKWNTMSLPLITKCCKSLQWHHAFNETDGIGVDYCYKCKTSKHDNVRRMTQLEYDTLTHPDITMGGLLDPKRMHDLINQTK